MSINTKKDRKTGDIIAQMCKSRFYRRTSAEEAFQQIDFFIAFVIEKLLITTIIPEAP